MRILPGKRLFNSSLIWEVVNRGDIFAVNLQTQIFTIFPGSLSVEFKNINTLVADDTNISVTPEVDLDDIYS